MTFPNPDSALIIELTEQVRLLTEAARALADEAETVKLDEDSIHQNEFYDAVDALRGVLDDHPRENRLEREREFFGDRGGSV